MGTIHWAARTSLERHDLVWLAQPFLEWFDVTHHLRFDSKGRHSSHAEFDSRDRGYEVLALQPTDASEELLTTNRELICVYSPFPRLDARTIELMDQLHRETRFDERISFIVSDDEYADAKIREVLSREPERFPIVAMSSEELRKAVRSGQFRHLVYERSYTRDLYAVESPLLSDNLFFGRNDLLERLTNRISAGQNSGIFGLRRIGKSSLLRALERRCRGGLALARYWDLSFATTLPFQDLLHKLVVDMASEVQLGRSTSRRLAALHQRYSPERASIEFADDMRRLLTHPQVRGNRIVLLLDELESITFGGVSPGQHWDLDFVPFWRTLRSIHQETQGALTFVVAGVNPYALETEAVGNYDNPLFGTVGDFYVQPLDRASTGTMVNQIGQLMGVKASPQLIDHLFEEYGGHPFLVRQACSRLSAKVARPGILTTQLYDTHRADIRADLKATASSIPDSRIPEI